MFTPLTEDVTHWQGLFGFNIFFRYYTYYLIGLIDLSSTTKHIAASNSYQRLSKKSGSVYMEKHTYTLALPVNDDDDDDP